MFRIFICLRRLSTIPDIVFVAGALVVVIVVVVFVVFVVVVKLRCSVKCYKPLIFRFRYTTPLASHPIIQGGGGDVLPSSTRNPSATSQSRSTHFAPI